eukprot:631126-Pyramimonas_sp.AAC.1
MQSLANQRAELEQYIVSERKAMEEAKAAAAERLRHADQPASDRPDLGGLRRQLEEFQHVLAGVQAGELRESLGAKYQNILEMLPPKP